MISSARTGNHQVVLQTIRQRAHVTLQDALARAQANAPQYRAALRIRSQERNVQAGLRLLRMSTTTHSSSTPRGMNNRTGRYIPQTVHEYLSEGVPPGTLMRLLSSEGACGGGLAKARA